MWNYSHERVESLTSDIYALNNKYEALHEAYLLLKESKIDDGIISRADLKTMKNSIIDLTNTISERDHEISNRKNELTAYRVEIEKLESKIGALYNENTRKDLIIKQLTY